jgi:cytochrome c-type biogenesis protein CcmH/NrfF
LNKRYKSALRGALIFTLLIAASSLQASDDRAETLGSGLICMCSCHQLLSGCEMINCPSAPPMRKELRQYIETGEDDKTILSSFSAKYGPKVLSAPSTEGWFNVSAWVMPFAVFAVGAAALVFSLKRLRVTPASDPAETPTPQPADTSAYEKEVEEELRKFTPED